MVDPSSCKVSFGGLSVALIIGMLLLRHPSSIRCLTQLLKGSNLLGREDRL